jgi:hypothetical protein
VYVVVYETGRQRSTATVDHGRIACIAVSAYLLDQVSFDQDILTLGQLVTRAIEDIDIFEQYLRCYMLLGHYWKSQSNGAEGDQ